MDGTENGLRAAVKALTDVIAPAVDKSDPLAGEQLRLVVDYLQFLQARLDFLHGRERYELRHNLHMGRALHAMAAEAPAELAADLHAAIAAGEAALGRIDALPSELKSVSAGLTASIRQLLRGTAQMPPASRQKLERCVLDMVQERIMFERAWYAPQGFDPAPAELPSVRAFLAGEDLATVLSR